MFFIRHLYALAVVLLAVGVAGHSVPAQPLKRIAHPSTVALEILPRRVRSSSSSLTRFAQLSPRSSTLRYDDSFRLTLTAFEETFHLHLRPNNDLVHPAARVHYYTTNPDGTSHVTETRPLLRETVKAYWGEVIEAGHSPSRMREDAAGVLRPSGARHPAELGWARIMVHHQGSIEDGIAPVFEGAFSVKGEIYHVMTRDKYLRTKHALDPVLDAVDSLDSHLVIWRERDVVVSEDPSPHSCAHDNLDYNVDPAQNPILQSRPPPPSFWPWSNLTLKRQNDVQGSGMGSNFADQIGNTDGCPNTQRVVYMGVAADCQYVSQYGSRDNATQQILNDWNSASTLYKNTFNVSLGIIELQVQDPQCPSTTNSSVPWNVGCDNVDLNQRLSIFSQWRGDKGNDSVGLWHLMSGCPTGSEVGIAWLGTLCQQNANSNSGQTVSGTAVSTSGRTEWQVIAHEIGHNFGAIHDCADGCNSSQACCPLSSSTCNADARFIMSPVSQSSEQNFSPCSLGNICSLMQGTSGGQVDTSCLVDPSQSTRQVISLQMCGNGIVEDGEDCDPGVGSNSTCCDASTCRFRDGAACDPQSSACCTDQCSFAPSTQVCRPSRDSSCDTEETCTGDSGDCPQDVFAPNGQSCGDDDLQCASGQCTSVARQCQMVGAAMGLTEACPNRGDNTCQISCQDPNRRNQCVLLSSQLIDGSPCGFGGTCSGGSCQAGSAIDTAKAWYTQNLQIAIPVTIVAGLVVIFLLFCCIRGIFRCLATNQNRSRARPRPSRASTLGRTRLTSYDPAAPTANLGPYPIFARGPPPIHPSMQSRQPQGGPIRSNWVDETTYNGPRPAH